MVLALIVIGSLIVIPTMRYATTVLKANTVLTAKTQRFEAVKAGLRTSLYDPLEVYRYCDEEVTPKPLSGSSFEINGIQVDSTCQLVGYASTVLDDKIRQYGLTVTEAGETIPPELKGSKYQTVAAGDWVGLTTSVFESELNPGDPPKVWLPSLPTHPRTIRTRVQGHNMPAGFGGCKVYFPGTYKDDIVLNGPTFFASGIYYFEGEVRVVGGADVTVGDGRVEGCATSQEAVFFADPSPGDSHDITGFGATWLFGGDGRLVVSNANAQPLKFQFNRRYVDDPNSDPSLFVSIASVNGDLDGVGTFQDYSDPGFVVVPMSRVMVGKDIYETPIAHEMTPSVLPDVARAPAPPTLNAPVAYRAAGSDLTIAGNNGAAYVTWQAPPVQAWGGSSLVRYEVFVRGEATPRCTVPANALYLECNVVGLYGGLTTTTHTIDVVAYNAVGASAPATTTVAVRNGLVGGTPAVHAALNPPAGVPTTTRDSGAVRVSWTAPVQADPKTPITSYTVTAKVQGTPAIADKTCTTLTRTATSCIVTGLSTSRNWQFTVKATNVAGMTSAASTSTANVLPNSGTAPSPDPNNPAPPAGTVLPTPPALNTAPIVEVDLAATSTATVRIPGYIAVPQGTVDIDNTPGHDVRLIGGILAAATLRRGWSGVATRLHGCSHARCRLCRSRLPVRIGPEETAHRLLHSGRSRDLGRGRPGQRERRIRRQLLGSAVELAGSSAWEHQLPGTQLVGVAAVGGDEFVVAADLRDAAVLDEGDAVGAADRGQAMGDHDGGAVAHRMVERRLDERLVLVVEVTRRLVEHHDAGVLEQQSGDREALLLATGEPVAPLAHDRVVPIGQCGDRVVDAGGLRRRDELFVGGVGVGIAQVVADRLVEEVRVL